MTTLTLLDGGMGRQLKSLGAPFKQPEWSALALMEAPHFVTQAHRQFIDAGCDIITTNNYAVVPFHIGEDRFRNQGVDLSRLAAQLARSAADECERDIRVAGSLPPLFGSYRADLFDYDRAVQLYPGVVASMQDNVDLWLGETLSCIDEARAIMTALSAGNKPVWLSFTVNDELESDGNAHLRSGDSIEKLAEVVIESLKPEAVLFNCSQPEVMAAALAQLQQALGDSANIIRTGAYANTFDTTKTKDTLANSEVSTTRSELTPHRYAEFITQWIEAGASIVGGCCGIGPEHIAEIDRRFRP